MGQLDQQILEKRCAIQSAQITYLSNIYHLLQSNMPISQTLERLPEVLPKEMQSVMIGVYVNDPGEGINLIAHSGIKESELEAMNTLFNHEFLLKEMIKGSHKTIHLSKQEDLVRIANIHSGILVPLLSSIECIGVLFVGFRDAEMIDEEIDHFIQTVGIQIGQAIALSTLFKKVKISEMRYRSLLENASCSIFIANLKGEILETNKQGEILLGCPRKKILGKRFKDYFVSPFREQLGEWTAQLANYKFLSQTEIQIRREDGEIRTVDGSGVLIEIEKEPLILMIGTDVTETNQFRAQSLTKDKLATLGLLAAGVAHEINNPIACIMSNLDFVKDKMQDNPLKKVISESIEAGERIKEIVNELNIYSQKDEMLENVNVCHVLDSAVNMAFPEWKNRAQIEKNYEADLPDLKLNRGKLHQVFLNLIVNAAHAIKEGDRDNNKIILTVKKAGDVMIIVVEDTGEGISSINMKKIFDPFFTTKSQRSGAGLGLFISHEIIQGMKGKIFAQSGQQEGSRFIIELPMKVAERL